MWFVPRRRQHRVRYALDVFRLAIEPAALARRRINVKTELGGDHDFVAEGRQRFPDEGFVCPGTVDLQRGAEAYELMKMEPRPALTG
jgi:hypothetical protein